MVDKGRAVDVAYQREMITVYEHLMGGFKEDGARLFSAVSSKGTKSNGHKLKCKKFHLNVRGETKCSDDGANCPDCGLSSLEVLGPGKGNVRSDLL